DLANGDTTGRWPVSDQPLPAPGALLPNKRIVAFYGNLYSARMGILGELPPDALLDKLDEEVARWNRADSVTEAVPALHYIAVTAQGNAGRDGKYRARIPFSQIDSVLRIAHKGNAIVFLDTSGLQHAGGGVAETGYVPEAATGSSWYRPRVFNEG